MHVTMESDCVDSTNQPDPELCPSCKGVIFGEEPNFCSLCRHALRPDSYERAALRGATWFVVSDSQRRSL